MKNGTEVSYASGCGPVTPWGRADFRTVYNKDVSFYGTPSHGGFRVVGKTLERIPEQFRTSRFHNGYGWFEEDCEWAYIAHFVPELFDIDDLEHADAILERYDMLEDKVTA